MGAEGTGREAAALVTGSCGVMGAGVGVGAVAGGVGAVCGGVGCGACTCCGCAAAAGRGRGEGDGGTVGAGAGWGVSTRCTVTAGCPPAVCCTSMRTGVPAGSGAESFSVSTWSATEICERPGGRPGGGAMILPVIACPAC